MKSTAVLVLLSSFCPLLRADLLVSIDTLCQATPSGSSIPVYTESHSAVFSNGLPLGTPVPGINCSTPYGSIKFGTYADQTATGVEMQAITTIQSAPNYSLTSSIDLRASTPQDIFVAVDGTGAAYLQGFSDCGGDAGFEGGAIQVSTVSLTGPLAQPCNPGPAAIKYPIVFGQPFTYGWQGEMAFQFQSAFFGDGGFYLFDNNTVTLAPVVDQNGNPIAGAHLVAVPEPKSFLLIVAALVLAAVRIGSAHGQGRLDSGRQNRADSRTLRVYELAIRHIIRAVSGASMRKLAVCFLAALAPAPLFGSSMATVITSASDPITFQNEMCQQISTGSLVTCQSGVFGGGAMASASASLGSISVNAQASVESFAFSASASASASYDYLLTLPGVSSGVVVGEYSIQSSAFADFPPVGTIGISQGNASVSFLLIPGETIPNQVALDSTFTSGQTLEIAGNASAGAGAGPPLGESASASIQLIGLFDQAGNPIPFTVVPEPAYWPVCAACLAVICICRRRPVRNNADRSV